MDAAELKVIPPFDEPSDARGRSGAAPPVTVVHVAPSVSRESSGASYVALRLCEALIGEGLDATLATLDDAPPPKAFIRLFPPSRGPRRLGRSPALRRWLDARAADGRTRILHAHGLWRMSLVYPAWSTRAGSARLVVSPHGSLSHWAMRHGSAFKPAFWVTVQRPALLRAACFHATGEPEYADIRRHGFRQPVAVIPNGVDLPALAAAPSSDDRILFYLGRLHPKKGVDVLIDAWRRVQDGFSAGRLVIAGDDIDGLGSSGYGDVLRRRVAACGAVRVSFVGELTGAAKWDAYRAAGLYVLPSHSENFGMTVAEALAAGTPVVTTRETPWLAIESRGAGWCIDTGTDALAACLREALAREPAALRRMGRRGRAWMAADFSWGEVGRRMARTYDWLLEPRAAAPDWVRTD